MFAIAHFVERNEIEVVPATWISGTLCKWPQGSTDRAKRLILKACPPEDTWVSYKVIVRGIYSTYAEARRKLNDLQYHSDVNSEAEMNTRKRNRLPPKRFCEESSEESDGDKNQNVPPFPPEKSGEKGRHGSLSQRNSAEHVGKSKKRRPPPLLEETDEEDLLLDVPPDFPSQCPSSSNLQYSGEQSQCPPSLPNENPEENNGPGITASQGVFTEHVARSKKRKSPALRNKEDDILFDVPPAQRNTSHLTSSNSQCPGDSTIMSEIMPTEIHRIPPFEQRTSQEECNKQILRLLHVLRLTQQQHGEILQELCKQRVVINEATEMPLLVESPFTLVETLEAFNTSLDEIKERRLVKELAQLGGNDVRVATRRMLGYLMKDETAAEYSWLGKKGKRKFAFLKFPQVIVKAIRMNKNMSMATQDEVESTIKTWLRHAKERCGNKSAPDD